MKTSSKRELSRLRAEVERLREENRHLSAVAYRDPLTGLRNRRFFNERLGEELCRRRRGKALTLSVIAVDLNDFKHLNDTKGHAAGDAALVAVGQFLEALTRTTDLACRVGGDEFVVLLPDTDALQCARVLQRLREHLPSLSKFGLSTRGLAFGAATLEPGDDELRLLSRADDQMYTDKRTSRARPAPLEVVARAA